MLTKVVSREKLKPYVGLVSINSNWSLRLKISSVVCWKGRLLGARDTLWIPAHTFCQSSFMSLFQKSSSQPCLLMRLDSSVSNTPKEERKLGEGKNKEPYSALSEELKQRAIFGHLWWVSERARHIERESFSLRGAVQRDREKHSESMREWKRKRRHFSLFKLHTRKINWWSSHLVFIQKKILLLALWWDYIYSLRFNLLCIQFIVDSSLAQTW